MGDNDKYETVIPGEGAAEPAADQPPSDGSPDVQTLKQERDDIYERLLRKQAEFENYKKRVEREKSEYAQFASSELIREILTALDSFELALKNAVNDVAGQNMLRGFELIYKQLQDKLGRFGLKPIEAKGQKFDPNFHQAVSTQATDEIEENTVVDEMRKGYLLHGRLLRPAMVVVSTKN